MKVKALTNLKAEGVYRLVGDTFYLDGDLGKSLAAKGLVEELSPPPAPRGRPPGKAREVEPHEQVPRKRGRPKKVRLE